MRFEAAVSLAAGEEGQSAVPAKPNPGGEDFAYYQTLVPGFFVWIGSDGTEEWHHPAFTVNEEALSTTARFFARLAEDVTAQWPRLMG